jgi:hypothetical protein
VKVSFGYSGSRHFFIVGFYLVRTHDRGVLLVALLPLLSVLLLLLVIPFPAYRLSVGGDGDATGALAFASPSACRNSQSMIDEKC